MLCRIAIERTYMALISCKNLNYAYDGVFALKNVSFEVNTGDYLCIVGENGAGKSTLMKGLLNLKKATSGQIIFGDNLKANEIGYLPQQSNVQKDFPADVFEVVLSGCLNKLGALPFYTSKLKKLAEKNMEKLGILNLKRASYQELSGGQQQRVLLARALCATTKLILLDEPVAGLDPKVSNEMYKLIDNINKEDNIAVVMISHDIHMAVQKANKILHISTEQKFFGSAEDYKNSAVGRYFIGEENV